MATLRTYSTGNTHISESRECPQLWRVLVFVQPVLGAGGTPRACQPASDLGAAERMAGFRSVVALRKYGEPDNPDTRPPSDPLPKVHKARKRLDPTATAELVAAYEAGATTRELMASYSLGKGAVLRLLRANGAQLRYQSMTPTEVDEVIRLYAQGLSLAAIGQRFDRNPSSIQHVLIRAGVLRRDPQGRER